MALYKIVRHFFHDDVTPNRTIKSGLYLKEAQAHCRDPESSSSTCKSAAGIARTRKYGPWFDGYSEERPKQRRRHR